MPAVPGGEAAKYVAAAYVVVFALVLIYVAIMALRLSRVQREVEEIAELAERLPAQGAADPAAEQEPSEERDPLVGDAGELADALARERA